MHTFYSETQWETLVEITSAVMLLVMSQFQPDLTTGILKRIVETLFTHSGSHSLRSVFLLAIRCAL